MEKKASAEKAIREIRRKTRRRFSEKEKIRIVIEGLRGEESIASLCRREGIAVLYGPCKQLPLQLVELLGADDLPFPERGESLKRLRRLLNRPF